MKTEVVIEGVRLTREQLERALEELNYVPPEVTVTLPRALAKSLALFCGYNVSIPELIRTHAPKYLDIMPTANQMGEIKCLIDEAMKS